MLAMPPSAGQRSTTSWGMTAMAIVGVTVFVGLFVRVGADCYWLVALGQDIAANRRIPDGIPFAEAPTGGWPNVVVLAELLLAGVHSLGAGALPAFQVTVVAATLALLAMGARGQGARDAPTALVLLAVAVASLPAIVIVRVQVFSLVFFALVLLLLRAEAVRPSRRAWLLPPLFAVWSNLHGAVLVGVAVTGAYLLFERLRTRRLETVMLGLASLVSLWVTPAGLATAEYYRGVLENEAAVRGTQLWARPDLSQPFDVLLVAGALVLVALTLRRRHALWEYVLIGGLVVGTAMAARHGVWLVMGLVAPAAVGAGARRTRASSATGGLPAKAAAGLVALAVVGSCAAAVVRGDTTLPAPQSVVDTVVRAAGDRVVLAPEPLVESLAVAGARVLVSNPIDAFPRSDQAGYLDFVDGAPGGAAVLDDADLVVVEAGTRSAALVQEDERFSEVDEVDGWTVYARRAT
jgi:hypothetical protein